MSIGGRTAVMVAVVLFFSVQLNNRSSVSAAQNRPKDLPSSQSLLSGCAVSAGNQPSCSIPAGWSLAVAEGFETGSVSGSESLQFASVVKGQAHTGNYAMREVISANNGNNQSPGGYWDLNGGGVGCCKNGEVYMSWWSYLDPSAQSQTESFFAVMAVNNGTGQSQSLVMDTQNPDGGLTTQPNLWFSPQSNDPRSVECANVPDGPAPQNCSFYGRNWKLNLGTWEQEEIWIRGSTCTGNKPNNDGFVRFYINGQLVMQQDVKHNGNPANPWNGGNINGCVDMSKNTELQIGGIWTYFTPGNPATFNKYIDDIIVLKR